MNFALASRLFDRYEVNGAFSFQAQLRGENMGQWSKLQKRLYLVIDKNIDFQVHCAVYRMQSQRGSTDLPRYWITLDKEILFDYPKQFVPLQAEYPYPYDGGVSEISALIQEYLDTPAKELLTKKFEADHWGLVPLLLAADRRIGRARWREIDRNSASESVKKILSAREKN